MTGPKSNILDQAGMINVIYREVGETKVSVENLSEKVDKHIDSTQLELQKINKLDQEQNLSLEKHIEGVKTLKDLYLNHRQESEDRIALMTESVQLQRKELSIRIETLEKPYNVVKYMAKVIMWVVTVIAALAGIMQWVKM